MQSTLRSPLNLPYPPVHAMVAHLESSASDPDLVCYYLYVNDTSRVQVARIDNVPEWYFERVVFPGQRLLIEAKPEAVLEIYSGEMATAVLSSRIPCTKLEPVWL